MGGINDEMKQAFVDESLEHLSSMETDLLLIEEGGAGQEYFVQIAKKKHDETEFFLLKNRSKSEVKKSAAEGGRKILDPFFSQNRRKMKKFRLFCPKSRIKSKKNKKKSSFKPW